MRTPAQWLGAGAVVLTLLFPMPFPPTAPDAAPASLGDYILLAWNDLGMHCMNRLHANFSVLPPYNNLHAQLLRRGDAYTAPQLVTGGASVEYSIPGNTYSVGKTDFWTYAPQLFGVTLPPDVGLTGKGLSGTLDPAGTQFVAEGIPITPFTDAQPTVEAPYQQALAVARGAGGVELARSEPVLPVSVEMACVSAGCHASETEILQGHEAVSGFSPTATPVLCAGCHADPALGTAGRPDAGYFSFRMHDQHKFLDEQMGGTALCYKCHPGGTARCLRGVMATRFGMACQDCHGSMNQVAASIETGRVPWLQEPACRTCHTARFGEPIGQLFRNSSGHGGVACEGCHNSTHAEWASSQPQDNANVLALQGVAGVLRDCAVCHGVNPPAPGPHDISATDVPEREILAGAAPLVIYPNPARAECVVRFRGASPEGGNLLVYDAEGRVVRLLRPRPQGADWLAASWDARDARGTAVQPGVYFVRWQQGTARAAGKVLIVK